MLSKNKLFLECVSHLFAKKLNIFNIIFLLYLLLFIIWIWIRIVSHNHPQSNFSLLWNFLCQAHYSTLLKFSLSLHVKKIQQILCQTIMWKTSRPGASRVHVFLCTLLNLTSTFSNSLCFLVFPIKQKTKQNKTRNKKKTHTEQTKNKK